ncbi:putative protein O-GlcNAc transferase [Dioscorea sansibarensis]
MENSFHSIVFVSFFISCTILFAPFLRFLTFFSPSLFFYHHPSLSFQSKSNTNINVYLNNGGGECSSSIPNNTICCDKTSYHTNICFMHGDISTYPPSSSITLHSYSNSSLKQNDTKIQPYTRKWETYLKDKIDELQLKIVGASDPKLHCDVLHDVPALFFSAGGYTGNVFHDFNNGILPIYITSQHLNGHVIFGVLQYSGWWYTRYHEILSRLSNYPPIIFSKVELKSHCFHEAILGLRFHGTLTIDSTQMDDNKTIGDFHQLLDNAYRHRVKRYVHETTNGKPKLVIISRNGSRAIENVGELVQLCKKIGFHVEVIIPESMELAAIYNTLHSCNVMVGVHGAGLTHILFMRTGSVLVQIVPLGLDELAKTCFGEPAKKMGIKYEEYKILPKESSLYQRYKASDPILRDPESVISKGWKVTKGVYLKGQNVSLDLHRIRVPLVRAFQHAVS